MVSQGNSIRHLEKGFPCGSVGKESTCNAGDLGSIPLLGRSPGERKGYPLQCSSLEDSMDSWSHKESVMTEQHSLSLNTYPLKRFQKTAEEETLQKSFYEATITLIPKPEIPQKEKIAGEYH